MKLQIKIISCGLFSLGYSPDYYKFHCANCDKDWWVNDIDDWNLLYNHFGITLEQSLKLDWNHMYKGGRARFL